GDGWVHGSFVAAPGTSGTLPPAPSGGTRYTIDTVYLRSGPGTSFSSITYLPAGATLQFSGTVENGFAQVSSSLGSGWVFAQYIGTSAPSTSAPPPAEIPTGTRYTTDTVHLRAGAGTSAASIHYLDAGVELQLLGEIENGFSRVTTAFGEGWVFTQYIGSERPAAPQPEPEPEPPAAPEPVARYTTVAVNLREGASTGSTVLQVVPLGTQVSFLGETSDGFARVSSNGVTGWVAAEFLASSPPATPAPEPEPEPPVTPEPVARYTTAAVNLRESASTGATVLRVVPLATQVSFSGETSEGFARVTSDGIAGWIASDFLASERPSVPPPAPNSLITWPVRGGEWTISQGYNGSSHQNRSGSWQYLYSLDLVRSDGGTAGQPVYSPVSGTVRWIDEASGGGSIYMGNGLAFAFFHVVLDSSVQEGGTVTQGQYLGTIAPAGQLGAGSRPHLHITIWETSDGGNWSRRAIPFTGNVAIAGASFPATGAPNTHRGITFNP
nr:SH3 domain-containing protein [Gemmatimonadota bacterium]